MNQPYAGLTRYGFVVVDGDDGTPIGIMLPMLNADDMPGMESLSDESAADISAGFALMVRDELLSGWRPTINTTP